MPYNDYRQNFRDRDNFRRNGRQRLDERVNEKEVPESRHAVFFRGFGPDISSEKIKDHFQDEIGPCIIDFYKNTPERTFVAVRFDSKDDAAKCMDKYKDGKLWGYELEVTWYRDIRRYVAHVKGGRNDRHDVPRRRDGGRRSRSRRGSRDGSDSEDESRRKRKHRDSSSSSSSSGSSAHSKRSSRPDSRAQHSKPESAAHSPAKKLESKRVDDSMDISGISDNEEKIERKPDLNKETRPEPDHRSIRQIAVERCPSIVDEKPTVDTMFNIRSQIIRELRHEPRKKSSSNGLQLSNLATKPEEIIRNKLAKFPEEFKSSVETKRKELEAVYRKDCQTFGLVAKKLVDKNADLEKSLKLALLGVLSDLEKETNETLLKYVEELELLFDA